MSEGYASEEPYSDACGVTSNKYFFIEVKKRSSYIIRVLFCNGIYSNVILPVRSKGFSYLLVI